MNEPIENYAMLSNCLSAALVSLSGSVDWLCFPRFDSPSIFARLLDEQGGRWELCVDDARTTTRKYIGRSLVLKTTHTTNEGACEVVDFLALDKGERDHGLGEGALPILVRSVRCVHGSLRVRCSISPRMEFGLVEPVFWEIKGGMRISGAASVLTVSTDRQLAIHDGAAQLTFQLHEGESANFALQHTAIAEPAPEALTQSEIWSKIDETIQDWERWCDRHQRYVGPWRDLVNHSGRVLQGLLYEPTAAIVAAPTTSLPEVKGGTRNWDYRFAWIRDASLTMEAFWTAGCPKEASRFFSFIANAASTQLARQRRMQIMFGINGEHDLYERELPWLRGWNDSAPVRVGNGAWEQHQLDVYGELLRSAFTLRKQLADMDDQTIAFLVASADAAACSWRQPDQGIWEIRGEARHFTHSKLMCWVALDCAVQMAELLKAADRLPSWTAERQALRGEILQKSWSSNAEAFAQSFGSDELDASSLLFPVVGFLPGSDPRVQSTIRAIARDLTDENGLVYRYRVEDGMSGREASFLFCTFWLAQAQALAGWIPEAKRTFHLACLCANDVGLMAEEYDGTNRTMLGNFPQAFSHVGLVNAAAAIAQRRLRSRTIR